MKIIYIILLFFLLHLRVCSEEKKPVEILADSMEWNKELSQAVATGNAKAIQGQTTIEANKIVAVLNEDNSQQITEKGSFLASFEPNTYFLLMFDLNFGFLVKHCIF